MKIFIYHWNGECIAVSVFASIAPLAHTIPVKTARFFLGRKLKIFQELSDESTNLCEPTNSRIYEFICIFVDSYYP